MTKKTKWSHLPNAAHIDRVVASVKAHPEAWYAAWDAAWGAAYGAAYDAAYDAARSAARNAAYRAAWGAAGGVARAAARGAILALIAWDDCAKYLDMTSDRLKVWGALSDDPACILLLPAVIAFEQIEEMEVV
jgi:hypothetical protein